MDYKCVSCSKSFAHANILKNHIHRVHEGHKDYKCEICEKSFSQAGHLKIHIKTIHEGHKDYKCDICDKSFCDSRKLKDHVTSILFMKASKITNVNIVVNHLLEQVI